MVPGHSPAVECRVRGVGRVMDGGEGDCITGRRAARDGDEVVMGGR